MGKSKKSSGTKPVRNVPLGQQLLEDTQVRPTGREKKRDRKQDDDKFADEKLSRKILSEARKQQEELQEEHGTAEPPQVKKVKSVWSPVKKRADDDDSSSDPEYDAEYPKLDGGDFDAYGETIEITEEDEKAFEMFMSSNAGARHDVADVIKERLTEKRTEIQSQMSDGASVSGFAPMDERLVKMYKDLRVVLQQYRSGRLPKAFKVIPSCVNWEQILEILEPEGWTAAAVYQATRMFVSNLKERMAQRFLNLILLPRIRDDIREYKRLNYHLYQAMRKALFKPGAFFKGMILPLCEEGTCTLREATLIASVIAKNSIRIYDSAAAILQLAEMNYTGANSIFMKTLLDKKYGLPYQTVDAVVYHFLRFTTDKRVMPVLWHQCLLTFVQRYKENLTEDQKEALLELLKIKVHAQITPEIRRELANSKCRGQEDDVEMS